MTRSKLITSVACCFALLIAGTILRTSAAQKSMPLKPQDKLALAEEQVKQLLPLMTADVHGKLSREEYLHFMEAAFDRLDKDKKGELDVRVLTQSSSVTANRFVGK
jgi:hypothetical protein